MVVLTLYFTDMKKTFFNLSIAFLMIFSSCEKDEPANVNFDVNAQNLVVNVNDSVTFDFKGSADIISVFTGEPGHEFKHKSRIEADVEGLRLSIESRVLYAAQEQNLRLFVSNDFSGTYDAQNVSNGTWVDLTERFTWSRLPIAGVGSIVPSGPADISEFIDVTKPMYFGFKYESEAAATAAAAGRQWRISRFDLQTVIPGGAVANIASVQSAGWKIVEVKSAVNDLTKKSYWVLNANPAYFLQFVPNSTIEPHVHWVITDPIVMEKAQIKPDRPVTIKTVIDRMTPSFKYAFSKSGNYTVTFVASNVNSHGQKEVVKEFNIEVK